MSTASNLRSQSAFVRWGTPMLFAVGGAVAGGQSSAPAAFVTACIAGPVGFLFGYWMSAWTDAAAEALDRAEQLVAAVQGVGTQLTTHLSGQHAQTIEMLRKLGEHLVNGDTRNTELLRVLAENTDALTRLDGPANSNTG